MHRTGQNILDPLDLVIFLWEKVCQCIPSHYLIQITGLFVTNMTCDKVVYTVPVLGEGLGHI